MNTVVFITKAYYLMRSHELVQKHPELAIQIRNLIQGIREMKYEEVQSKFDKDSIIHYQSNCTLMLIAEPSIVVPLSVKRA